MKPLQKASVCGLGKLGACIAATLAQRGFDVLGIDIDPEKVRRINAGQPPVEEPLWRRPSPPAIRGCAPRKTTVKQWPRT
jgi:UDP-N-acetyl-D-mannosaminuronate dehydrogenase